MFIAYPKIPLSLLSKHYVYERSYLFCFPSDFKRQWTNVHGKPRSSTAAASSVLLTNTLYDFIKNTQQTACIQDKTKRLKQFKQAVRVATQYASAPCKLTTSSYLFLTPIPACWLSKTSATSWPLTFWPWKCPSHVWCRLPLCQF